MESLSGMFSKIFLRAAFVSILLGIIARLFYFESGSANIPWLFGITASAFLRFTDTCLLFTIAFALIHLIGKKESKEEARPE
ncbi:MAG: hypothetical protein N3A72_04165 [bacterium]|nr:hypothetical protein [bacterium]